MKVEVGNAIFTLRWVVPMVRTLDAPYEGGDFEVVDVEYTGHVTDDEEITLEEEAFAIAYERLEWCD